MESELYIESIIHSNRSIGPRASTGFYMILDRDGNIHSWKYSNEQPDNIITKYRECDNSYVIELNSQYRWTRLVNLFYRDDIGLVNERGEVYIINSNFMINRTDISPEIFAVRPSRIKRVGRN